MNIGEIIYKTLIDGDSYKTLLKGLGMTLQISLFSIVIGTLLGMVICALRRSRLRIIRGIAAGYIAVVRGSPVVLLLMLMYLCGIRRERRVCIDGGCSGIFSPYECLYGSLFLWQRTGV